MIFKNTINIQSKNLLKTVLKNGTVEHLLYILYIDLILS